MEFLREYFKEIKNLHDYQEASIKNIIEKKNTLTIAPTGGGKSLIFQLAALNLEGVTLVISPLKALMNEQINELQERGIKAIAIHSDIPFEKQRKILRDLKSTKPKLIYVSPERLFNYFFRAALKLSDLKIALIVIDEAHCISQWGIDFRPEYGNIMPFVDYIREVGNEPVIFALTATMSKKAKDDIKSEFSFHDNDEIIANEIIRTNLEMNFDEVNKEDEKIERLLSFVDNHNLKKVLVYTYSRQKCEELAVIRSSFDYFHSGMDSERKIKIMEDFKKGKIEILFATTAFGMGINIPDIDGVIHYQIPESVEEYYQHIGRGARNEKLVPKCKCLMLWSETNFERKATRIAGNTLEKEDLIKGFKHLNLEGKAEKKTYIKYDEIYSNDGSRGKLNLSLIKRMFEKHGVCKEIGDIYGNPLDIAFKSNTKLWDDLVKKLGGRNQFLMAERKTGISIEQLIDHVYEQEIADNIKKLPATKRVLFLESNYDSLPEDKMDKIIKESQAVLSFKLDNLEKLKKLVKCANPENYIADVLKVQN